MLRHLLIAEDHPLYARGLEQLVHDHDPAVHVQTAFTFAQTCSLLSEHDYAALILDLDFCDGHGIGLIREARIRQTDVPILVVTDNSAPSIAAQCKAVGAHGFVRKDASVAELAQAIAAVLEGGFHFGADPVPTEGSMLSFVSHLSPAQARVLRQLAAGHANKVIASNLGIAEATVKAHLSAIYRALGVSNRSAAILKLQAFVLGAARSE